MSAKSPKRMTSVHGYGCGLPTAPRLGHAFGLDAAQIGDVIAPVTGTYLVLVGSADSGLDGTGTYRLTIGEDPRPCCSFYR